MKRFIIKTSFFVIPFIIFHFINLLFYKKDGGGDLSRLGFIYYNPSPFDETIKKYDSLPIKYTPITNINLNKKTKYDVLTIGDSFSEQGGYGFPNYLAHKGLSVLHINRFLSEESPIQSLVELINSNFFDTIKTDYVVLESVERALMIRNKTLSFSGKKSLDSIKTQINNHNYNTNHTTSSSSKIEFFSDATIKIPLTNFQYLFMARPLKSDIYRYKSNSNILFSNNPDDLLFFKDDLKTLKDKNDPEQIKSLNNNLNKINDLLNKKGIKLIVLIAPDKYDLYYPYIKDKNKEEPLFFQKFKSLPKNYIYISSYEALSTSIKKDKDIYFYDDTHWTTKGSNIIANEIYKTIKK